MYKPVIPICVILLLIAPYIAAQQQSDDIDPVVVSATMYKVLLENEYVRVVEYQINPGERDNWHTHPAKASYVVSGGSLRITTAEGESFIVDEATGSASWFDTVGKHFAENVGTTPIRIVLVEVKRIAAKKQDLSKYKNNEKG